METVPSLFANCANKDGAPGRQHRPHNHPPLAKTARSEPSDKVVVGSGGPRPGHKPCLLVLEVVIIHFFRSLSVLRMSVLRPPCGPVANLFGPVCQSDTFVFASGALRCGNRRPPWTCRRQAPELQTNSQFLLPGTDPYSRLSGSEKRDIRSQYSLSGQTSVQALPWPLPQRAGWIQNPQTSFPALPLRTARHPVARHSPEQRLILCRCKRGRQTHKQRNSPNGPPASSDNPFLSVLLFVAIIAGNPAPLPLPETLLATKGMSS